ncbi:TPA: hypothetical protein ACQZHW_003131 [Enterobacter hormaechei]
MDDEYGNFAEIVDKTYNKKVNYSKYSPELLALKHAIEDRNNKILDEDIKRREFINTSLSKEEAKALRESIRKMVKDRVI